MSSRGHAGEPAEHYTGTMTTLGLDIGVTTGGAIVWAVFADTSRYAAACSPAHMLARRRKCRSRAGLGANVLVGGSTARSRCSRSRCRARSASTSPPASVNSICIPCTNSAAALLAAGSQQDMHTIQCGSAT